MESKVIQGKNVNEAEIKPSTNVEKKVIFQPYASVVFILFIYFFFWHYIMVALGHVFVKWLTAKQN